MLKTAQIVFIRLDKTLERDGQTDRQTDRYPLAIAAVCIASNADAL